MRSFDKTLKKMYARREDVRPEFRDELEADVMTRYRTQYSKHGKWSMFWNPKHAVGRYALGSLMVVALLGVACEVPTSTPVDMGHQFHVSVAPTTDDVGKLEADLQEALAALGAEKVGVRFRQIDGAPTTLDLLVWGRHVSQQDVERVLTERIGADRLLSVDIAPLTGEVSETIGRRIGRSLFGTELSDETAEGLRLAILERLAAEGFDGATNVQVQDDGSVRKITVDAGTADGSRAIADEVIIDRGEP